MAVRVQRALDVSAEEAYEYFCAVETIPRWVEPVQRVTIHRRDSENRAADVEFETIGDDRKRLVYSLRYNYDPEGLRVMWQPLQNPQFAVRGVAAFEPKGSGSEVTYTIDLTPTWADDYAGATARAKSFIDAFAGWVSTLQDSQPGMRL